MSDRPHKGERPGVSGARPSHQGPCNQAAVSVADDDEADNYPKRLTTAQASFALLGAELVPIKSGGLTLSAGGFLRHLDSLAAAEKFLVQIGGR
jgi:hypothetical protein